MENLSIDDISLSPEEEESFWAGIEEADEMRAAESACGDDAFVFRFPVRFLAVVAKKNAERAMPLALAARWRLCSHRRLICPLTRSVWAAAGLPDCKKHERQRRTALKALREIKSIFVLETRRSRLARYWIRYGPTWRKSDRM
jgi:hypothetical protein